MTIPSAQTQAITNANQIIALSSSLLSLYNDITVLTNSWSDDNSLTILQNFGTCAQNTDGSLGTIDTTPNNAHPINLANYPGLNRQVSANQLINALVQLEAVVSYLNGNALSATPGARTVLNAVVGG